MQTLMSIKPGFLSTELRTLTETNEKELRDSKEVLEIMNKVRNGEKDAKKQAFNRLPQAMFPEGVTSTTRKKENLASNGRVYLDYDHRTSDKTGGEFLLDCFKGKEEKYGLLQLGNSISGNGFAIVKQIEGLTIGETFDYFEYTLGLKFDRAFRDNIAQCAIITPSSEILYESEEYFSGMVNTNKSIDTSEFLEYKHEHEAKRIANAMPEFTSTNTMDFNMDRAQIKMIVNNCEAYGIDLCSSYKDWINVAMSIYNTLGEEGYEYFYRLSMLWTNGVPNERDIRKKWDNIAHSQGKGITIGTLIYLARKANAY